MSIAPFVYFCSLVALEIGLVKSCQDIHSESQQEQEPGLAGWPGSPVPMGSLTRASKQCRQTPGLPGQQAYCVARVGGGVL